MKSAVLTAALGREEGLAAIKRLDDQARQMEFFADGPPLETHIAGERARSPDYGGRSVFGWEADIKPFKRASD